MKIENGVDKQPADWLKFLRRHWITIRSWLLFAATLGLWLIWYPVIVRSGALDGLLLFNARLTGDALNLLGAGVQVHDTVITSALFTLRVGHECTAVVPIVILLCALIAYPSRLTYKLACAAIGIPVLFALNLVRLVTLYYIGVFIPDFFEIAHFFIWQSVMILAVVAIWLLWVGKVANVRPA
jgi:archaeosortase B (VPXXXP-CTERM-specific)